MENYKTYLDAFSKHLSGFNMRNLAKTSKNQIV